MKKPYRITSQWPWLNNTREKTLFIRPNQHDVFKLIDDQCWISWTEIQHLLEFYLKQKVVNEALYYELDTLMSEGKIIQRTSTVASKCYKFQLEFQRKTAIT